MQCRDGTIYEALLVASPSERKEGERVKVVFVAIPGVSRSRSLAGNRISARRFVVRPIYLPPSAIRARVRLDLNLIRGAGKKNRSRREQQGQDRIISPAIYSQIGAGRGHQSPFTTPVI